jgi:hypothetical protein
VTAPSAHCDTRTVRIIRALAVAVISAGAALGLAAPAQAQGDVKAPGVPEGVYTVNVDGQSTTEWEIYPICVPTVGDLREPLLLPVGCRLKVTPTGRGGMEAVQIGNMWSFEFNEYNNMEAVTCPDGSKAAQREIYTFDNSMRVGELTLIRGAICGWQPTMIKVPLTMAYNRPLPIPVDQYPLICEPGGLRRCF